MLGRLFVSLVRLLLAVSYWYRPPRPRFTQDESEKRINPEKKRVVATDRPPPHSSPDS